MTKTIDGTGYGYPYIPLSQLREMYRTARTMVLEDDYGLDEKWVWTTLVRLEIDRIMIQEYQTQLHQAATYQGYEAWGCPLCTYRNGVFLHPCSLHSQIDELREENKDIRDQNNKLINTMANYIHSDWPEWEEMKPSWGIRTFSEIEEGITVQQELETLKENNEKLATVLTELMEASVNRVNELTKENRDLKTKLQNIARRIFTEIAEAIEATHAPSD